MNTVRRELKLSQNTVHKELLRCFIFNPFVAWSGVFVQGKSFPAASFNLPSVPWPTQVIKTCLTSFETGCYFLQVYHALYTWVCHRRVGSMGLNLAGGREIACVSTLMV